MSCRHSWKREYEAVGGDKKNPGCWDTGRGTLIFHYHCSKCGRRKHDEYSYTKKKTLNTEYLPADERTLAWIAEN